MNDAVQSVEVAFKTGQHPLFENSRVKVSTLEALTAVVKDIVERAQKPLEQNNKSELVDLFVKASEALGYTLDRTMANVAIDNTQVFHSLANNLNSIVDNLTKAIGNENYDPFKFRGENSISGYLKNFLRPFTEKLEETAVSSFYDSGKMYQSYVTPSYLTVMMDKFTGDDARFQEFLN